LRRGRLEASPLREQTPDWPVALAANPLPEPDLAAAKRHDVVFNGGMMGVIRVANETIWIS
jgi:hypothetical protein